MNILFACWAPFIIDVQVSLGRLNEPTFPHKDEFWWFDDDAAAYMQERCGSAPPTEAQLAGMNKDNRGCFLDAYRDAKRKWVNDEVSRWVTNNLKTWQRYMAFPAGGSGDLSYPDPNDTDNTYYSQAKNSWSGAGDAVKRTIRHMDDNYWLLGRAKKGNWNTQFAGVQGVGCHEDGSICVWLPDHRNNYTGPIYAQIAGLITSDCEQPDKVADNV